MTTTPTAQDRCDHGEAGAHQFLGQCPVSGEPHDISCLGPDAAQRPGEPQDRSSE